MAYWEERRDKKPFGGMTAPSYHLDLDFIENSWNDDRDEVRNVMRGLHKLNLPIDLIETEKAALLKTPLPSLVEIAAPSLTHLTLDAKGLIQDGIPRDNLGSLSFETFFSKLHMPRIVQLDMLGWVYTQAQLQRFLLRHAGSLRELRLMHNLMIEGDVVALADFGRDRMSLTGIELDWRADQREAPEGVKIPDESMSSLSMPERWLKHQCERPCFALELRWLGGHRNQIVRARQWHCDQCVSSVIVE